MEAAQPAFAAAPDAAPSSETDGEDEAPQEELTLDMVRSVRFDDVAGEDRFSDAISYLAYREIFLGCDDDCFRPDDYVTRGQLVTLLHRLSNAAEDESPDDEAQWAVEAGILQVVEGVPVETYDLAESYDPPESRDKTVLVLSGAAEGEDSEDGVQWVIVGKSVQEAASGAAETYTLVESYDENARITRAQMAVMLYRFARYSGADADCTDDLSRYPDAASVPDYARTPVSWAMEHRIFGAMVVDSICPSLAVSRAQTAAALTALVAELDAEPVAEQITDAAAQTALVSVSRAGHEELQNYVDSVAKKYGASGLQVAVVENGHVTDSFSYGWATRKTDEMTADHKMRVASISKVIIGMDAVRMTEDGLIDLDAPIGTYWGADFKNPYYPDRAVNARGILSHTSSIAMLEAISAHTYAAVKSRQQSSAGYSHVVPGSLSSWGYNNYAFGVLGMTLELAAGKTLDQMLEGYFFDVMDIDAGFYAGDIDNTYWLVTLSDHGGTVQRSVVTQKNLHAGTPGSSGSAFAGGLTISAKDLGKLTAVLANDGEYEGLKMLAPESVAIMESFDEKTVSNGFCQALPLRYKTDIYGRDGLYYHTGSAYGVYNCLSYDPESRDGVVVLSVGASATQDKYGIYAVCGNISEYIYQTIKR